MTKRIFIFFFILTSLCASGQNILTTNNFTVTPITGIDWKLGNYNHVTLFDSILAENKILVLAEIDHGDGNSIEAKCAILKDLIDSGKVNMIFTETNWITIYAIVKLLKEEGEGAIKKTHEYMRSYDLKYWVDNGFWDYLCGKIIQNKIKLVGFDIDATSPKVIDPLFAEAMNIDTVKRLIKKEPKNFESLNQDYKVFIGWGLQSRYDWQHYSVQKKFIDAVLYFYRSVNDEFKVKEWQTIHDFFYWMYKRSEVLQYNKYSNQVENKLQNSAFHAVRDSLMAEVFYKSYQENKNAKIVAIMSAYHAMKYPWEIEGADCCINSTIKPMNEILTKKYKLPLFNVGFIRGSGAFGINYGEGPLKRSQYNQVMKPVKGSLEKELYELPYEYCLVNFNNNKATPFLMHLEFDKYLRSDWINNFPAVFFIKKMGPLVYKNIFNE